MLFVGVSGGIHLRKIILICISSAILLFLISYSFPSLKSWKPWSLPLSGKIIVIDAGHGGIDGGAERDGIQEKEITLLIAEKTKDYLQEQGAIVILTRDDDYDLAETDTKSISLRKAQDLKARSEIINGSDADFFLSIHLNSFPSASSKGAQTFYYQSMDENKRVAKLLQDELKDSLENTDRKAKRIQHVYLLRKAEIPGALVEVGFLSHSEERELLVSERYQDKVAEALYRGILRYYTDSGDK